jgi:hypothetical protein
MGSRYKLIATTSSLSSCACCRKYQDKNACIKVERVEFEHVCLLDLTTCSHPIIFPPYLQETNEITKWAREAIQIHQLARTLPLDEYLVHLSIPPSFVTLMYKNRKTYRNHFQVDDEHCSLLVTIYDSSVPFVF